MMRASEGTACFMLQVSWLRSSKESTHMEKNAIKNIKTQAAWL